MENIPTGITQDTKFIKSRRDVNVVGLVLFRVMLNIFHSLYDERASHLFLCPLYTHDLCTQKSIGG